MKFHFLNTQYSWISKLSAVVIHKKNTESFEHMIQYNQSPIFPVNFFSQTFKYTCSELHHKNRPQIISPHLENLEIAYP